MFYIVVFIKSKNFILKFFLYKFKNLFLFPTNMWRSTKRIALNFLSLNLWMLNSDTESVTFCKKKIPPLRRTDRLRFLSIHGIVSSLPFVNDLPVFSISLYLSFSFWRKRRQTSNGFNSPWRAAKLVLKGKEIFFGAWIVDQAVGLKSE